MIIHATTAWSALTRATTFRPLLAASLVVALLAVVAPPAESYPGAPWFEPSQPYAENFPDPHILVHGGTYYAYATNTGGSYLPAMSSTDLRTWIARPAYDPGRPENIDPYFNDSLPRPAAWGVDRPVGDRMTKEVWAPGVAEIGGQFVAFYALRERVDRDRFCISVATSDSPLGPFADTSTEPLVCDADPNGSIDPFPFVDPATGAAYLLWKSEGVPGGAPTRIWSRRLSADGTRFARGSTPNVLLATSLPWEGNVVENPAMIRHGGQLYLFYSANEWRSASYAIGYATCASPTGGCQKRSATPLVASRDGRLGPGGPAPFVDLEGRLRLGYHAWNAPYSDYPSFPACQTAGTCATQGQRRLRIDHVLHGGGGWLIASPRDTFLDLHPSAYYTAPVEWLKRRAITTGLGGNDLFGPDLPVTRGQMATFLWRWAGEPAPAVGQRFTDVRSGLFYDRPVRWLDEHGITTGHAGTDRFAPDASITRGQMATFLWRLAGRPTPSGGQPFVDVRRGAFYDVAIRWLAEAGITTGVGGSNRFAPDALVSRAQMATFLQRFDLW